MSIKIWSGLVNGLKFKCTACGKCCQSKRANISLNLSEVKVCVCVSMCVSVYMCVYVCLFLYVHVCV